MSISSASERSHRVAIRRQSGKRAKTDSKQGKEVNEKRGVEAMAAVRLEEQGTRHRHRQSDRQGVLSRAWRKRRHAVEIPLTGSCFLNVTSPCLVFLIIIKTAAFDITKTDLIQRGRVQKNQHSPSSGVKTASHSLSRQKLNNKHRTLP